MSWRAVSWAWWMMSSQEWAVGLMSTRTPFCAQTFISRAQSRYMLAIACSVRSASVPGVLCASRHSLPSRPR